MSVAFPFAMYAKVGCGAGRIGMLERLQGTRDVTATDACCGCDMAALWPPQVYKTSGTTLLLMKVTAFVMLLVGVAGEPCWE